MVEVLDSLRSLFSATVEGQDGTYVIEVPSSEIEQKALAAEKTYRVALLDAPSSTDSRTKTDSQESHSRQHTSQPQSDPPVDTLVRDERLRLTISPGHVEHSTFVRSLLNLNLTILYCDVFTLLLHPLDAF